jgi:hypothetical protein
MKNIYLSCLAAIPLMTLAGCASDQPASTTTTTSEETVSQPPPSATTTETTVQKN